MSTPPRRPVVVKRFSDGEAVLYTVTGVIDEEFGGFQQPGAAQPLVIDVSGLDSITSFGMREWLKAIEPLSKMNADVYLLGCPTFFVDQLNMVVNFAGTGKVITAFAPYTCTACGAESAEPIDVLAHRSTLRKEAPERSCARCRGKLELDEAAESYFAFVAKRGAQTIHPAAARLLTSRGLYSRSDVAAEKPPSVIKIVHGSVTYFRIKGIIGALFRARPLLVGAEGEVVIDLADVERFEVAGQKEWRRLIKSLAAQVPSITLVDVSGSFLEVSGETVTIARHVHVATLLVPYTCADCGRAARESKAVALMDWPPQFHDQVCSTCGGTRRANLAVDALAPLRQASTTPPSASAKVIDHRDEILSRAFTDASVAHAATTDRIMAVPDTVLGKYQIVRRLSAGGMAEVFLAKQVGLGGFEKPVAIKRIQNKLLENRHQTIELFLNEAKIAGRLTHPNIVQVLDVGEERGALYLAMEYVNGRDLRDVMKALQKQETVMPLPEACHIVREVAKALDYAYWSTDITGKQLSVVHRDVSPHNVILGYDGTVKLLDFGVAMSSITENAQALIVGKWTYMSPETMISGTTDHRSDLFSLGVILYLLCSGKNPFAGSEPKVIAKKIKTGDYERLAAVAPHLPAELSTLVARMLASKPEFRPQRGEEVVEELNAIIRKYGLDSSGADLGRRVRDAERVAEYLESVLPAQPVPAEHIKQLVRVPGQEPATSQEPTRVTPVPQSITPSARTSHRAFDASESFKRITVETPIPWTPSMPPMQITFEAPASVGMGRSAMAVRVLIAVLLLAATSIAGYFLVASVFR